MFFVNFENKQAAFVEQNLKWHRFSENFKRLKTVIGISNYRGPEKNVFRSSTTMVSCNTIYTISYLLYNATITRTLSRRIADSVVLTGTRRPGKK